jgi:lambda family phage tail tape measure protein
VQVQQQSVGLARQQQALQAQTAINAARTTAAQQRAQTAANATARSTLSVRMQQMRQQALQARLAQQGAGGGGGGAGGGGSAIIAGGRNALAAIGGAAALGSVIRLADEYTNLNARVSLVTNSERQHAEVMDELAKTAMDTRVGLRATADVYTSLARNNEALALTQREIIDLTRTVNQSIAISGTSAVSAGFGLMQLGQAFGTGQLRGEELNSVLEQMPRLAQAIAQGLPDELVQQIGVRTPGALKTLAEQGKLTVDIVLQSIQRMAPVLEEEFRRMPLTVSQGFTVLRTGFQLFIAEFDKASGATQGLGRLLANIGRGLSSREFVQFAADVGNVVADVASVIGDGLGQAFQFLRDNADTAGTALQVVGSVLLGLMASRGLLNIVRSLGSGLGLVGNLHPALRLVSLAATVAGGALAYFTTEQVRSAVAARRAATEDQALANVQQMSADQVAEMTRVERESTLALLERAVASREAADAEAARALAIAQTNREMIAQRAAQFSASGARGSLVTATNDALANANRNVVGAQERANATRSALQVARDQVSRLVGPTSSTITSQEGQRFVNLSSEDQTALQRLIGTLSPAAQRTEQYAKAVELVRRANNSNNVEVQRQIRLLGGVDNIIAGIERQYGQAASAIGRFNEELAQQRELAEKIRDNPVGSVSTNVERRLAQLRNEIAREGGEQTTDPNDPRVRLAAERQRAGIVAQERLELENNIRAAATDTAEQLRQQAVLQGLSGAALAEQRAIYDALNASRAAGLQLTETEIKALLQANGLLASIGKSAGKIAGADFAKAMREMQAEFQQRRELFALPIDEQALEQRMQQVRQRIAAAMGGDALPTDAAVRVRAEQERAAVIADMRLETENQIRGNVLQRSREAETEYRLSSLTGVELETQRAQLEAINALKASGLRYTDQEIKAIVDRQLPAMQKAAQLRERANIIAGATSQSQDMVRDLTVQAETIGLVGDALEVARFRADALYRLQQAYPRGIIPQSEIDTINRLAANMEQAQARLAENRTFANGLREGINEFAMNAQDTFQIARQGVSQMAQHMEDAIMNFATTGKFAFKDFASAVIKDIMRIIARQLILNTVMRAVGMFMGAPSVGGGVNAMPQGDVVAGLNAFANTGGIAHKGAIAGKTTSMRTLSSLAFAGAQRYHAGGLAGLGKNEVPIIANRGEAILPTVRLPNGQMGVQAAGGGGGGVFAPQINITVNGGNSGGNDAEGQAAFARSIAKEMDRALEMKMREFTSTQMRPGGMFNGGMR